MGKYAGTQTEKNLQAAFAGESQARNKYTYFASVAKKEGYEQIAEIFLHSVHNVDNIVAGAFQVGNEVHKVNSCLIFVVTLIDILNVCGA